MEIVVFAQCFRRGSWEPWEHQCGIEEVEGVADSARAYAADRGRIGLPVLVDYLDGARYIFDVAYGPPDSPKDGDIQIYGISVDGMLIGTYRELRYHLKVVKQAAA